MENRLFINVCSDRFTDEILLETQSALPLKEVLKDILLILNWPIEVDGQALEYLLTTEEKTLDLSGSLEKAGVENFETIWISPHESGQKTPASQENNPPEDTQPAFSAAPPYWALIPVEQPALIHPDGYMILLGKPPLLIGRKGGDKPVQVDLSEFEKDRWISSRSHAEIILEEGEYCLRALNTRNGTFIGREELKPGQVHPLKNNDVIQFGSGGVRLIFRKP